MACQKCGSIIQDGLSVCPVCGADLTIQSNYKQNQANQNISNYTNDNNVVNNTLPEMTPKGKKNVSLIVIIVLVSILIAFVGIVLIDRISSNKNQDDDVLRDINTVNDNNSTTKSTTTKKNVSNKTTEKSNTQSEGDVTIDNLVFTVPLGFEFGVSESNEETRKYYLMRKEADALINFDIKSLSTTIDNVFNEIKNNYLDEESVIFDNEIYNYKNYKYYRVLHKEVISSKNIKEHVQIIMQIDDNNYIDAYINNAPDFGEQNYIQTLVKFIDSKK